MNKIINVILLFTIIINTTSCYDKVELEDRDFILTIGIDKYIEEEQSSMNNTDEQSSETSEQNSNSTIQSRENIIENGLKNNRFTVTLSIPDPYAVTNHDDEVERIIYGHGETITSAINEISTNSGTYLDFAQTKVLILGKSLLEDKELFKQTIDAIERNKRLSRKVLVLGTEHNAKDIMLAEVKDVKILGYFLSNYYSSNKTANAHSSNQSLLSLIQSLEKSNDAIIPLVAIKDNQLNLSNALAIKDFIWKDIIYSEHLQGYTIMNPDENAPVFITTEYEDFFIPLRSTKRKIDTSIRNENNELYYDIDIKIEGNINEFSFGEDSLLDKDTLKKLEDSFNKSIEIDILNTFYFFQNEASIDGLNIIDEMYKNNYQLYKLYEDTDDDNLLKLFKPKVTVTTTINSVGSTN